MRNLSIQPFAPPRWPEVEPLIQRSEAEGFRFLRRLRTEYEAGSNRFDAAGEVLLGAYADRILVAVGGLNRDPHAPDAVGRVRRLYVLPEYRGRGVGAAMLERLLAAARQSFSVVHLRTDSSEAARFYERLGFEALRDCATATHRLIL